MLHNAFPCSSLLSALQSSMRTFELSLLSPVLQYLGCAERCQFCCDAQGVLLLVRILASDNWLSSAAELFCVGWACELRAMIERMCFSNCTFVFPLHDACLFFFSFVRITTYSFLMLFKIPYEFMGMLWCLPRASKVCQFSGQDSCSFRLHYLQSLHMYSGEKVVYRGIYRDRLFYLY